MSNDAATAHVTCRVVGIHAVHSSRLIALASVEIEGDGIVFTVHGIQVVRARSEGKEATGVDLPRYRAPDGTWQRAVALPDELLKPIAAVVLDECLETGLVKRKVAG